jgi:hypothetical protein
LWAFRGLDWSSELRPAFNSRLPIQATENQNVNDNQMVECPDLGRFWQGYLYAMSAPGGILLLDMLLRVSDRQTRPVI